MYASETQTELSLLLKASEGVQRKSGYFHTLREIWQQPATWIDTAERMIASREVLSRFIEGCRTVILTGSGSSEYASICVAPALRQTLALPVEVVGGGALLIGGSAAMTPIRPALIVSLARSGNSPESAEALRVLLETQPEVRHLIITCNKDGKLATGYRAVPNVSMVVLDQRTNDCSLVMTSSFTNLVVAALSIALIHDPEAYRNLVSRLAAAAQHLLSRHAATIASIARRAFHRTCFLANWTNVGAARESALKVLEMTAGRVITVAETYLGVRHGPMSAIHDDTLIVCYLSTDPLVRVYELDLIRELNRKRLGHTKLVVGENIPSDLLLEGDAAIEVPGMTEIEDQNSAVLHVMAGQLLGFFRCRAEGLKPDSPSENGVINRVVETFPIHRLDGAER